MFGFKKWRRKRLMQQSFPDRWNSILRQNVPYAGYLPQALQEKLKGLISIFLEEKTFEGCAGLEISDEIRVTIAAQASILMLGLDDLASFYNNLRSVLVYPKPYVVRIKNRHDSFFVQEGFQQRRGEAWARGHVVLAWDQVQRGASDIHDGQNLVFHEFAHQLDFEYGATDQIENREAGDGNDDNESHFYSWARVVGGEYQKFLRAIQRDQRTLIDAYGATNLAEFFAVVTEYFFEKPRELKDTYPELYGQLQGFYRQDPASYLSSQ